MNERLHSMWRIAYLLPFSIVALSSCVSGAPTLSDDQEHKLDTYGLPAGAAAE